MRKANVVKLDEKDKFVEANVNSDHFVGIGYRPQSQTLHSTKKGQRLLNERDMIFRESGTKLVLPVEEQGVLAATYRIAMRPGQPRQNRGRAAGPPQ